MKNGQERSPLRKDLRALYGDGLGFSLMVGLGETYVPAFVLALGLGEIAAGWIVSFPMLLGAMLQLISPLAVRRLRSHRRWVVLCASAQALCCLAYLGIALGGTCSSWLVFTTAALYWATGMGAGPAWNTWVGTLLPRSIRARFLASRARGCQAAVLIGLVSGGLALQYGSGRGNLLTIFALMFLLSALGRLASAGFLWTQSEPVPLPANHRGVRPLELLRRARHGADGRLLVFMVAIQAAVQISGPFFTPYMLGELHFSYATYLLLIATAFLAKMLAFPLLGAAAKRFGSDWLLYASTIGILPLSALWIFSNGLVYLVVLQLVGGAIWAGYELSTMLLLFERIDQSERTSVLTLFNLANAGAIVVGSLAGGMLLEFMNTTELGYHLLFGLSGIARVLAVLFVLRLSHVAFRPAVLIPRVLAVRPNTGSLDAPLLTSMEERPVEGEKGQDARLSGGAD